MAQYSISIITEQPALLKPVLNKQFLSDSDLHTLAKISPGSFFQKLLNLQNLPLILLSNCKNQKISKKMSKITDLEEGEIMDLDQSTDQVIDDLLKVSIISIFRRRLELKLFWLAIYTILIFPP